MRSFTTVACALMLAFAFVNSPFHAAGWADRKAEAAFAQGVSAANLRDVYHSLAIPAEKVRILIVPGHQPDAGGTRFGSVYERDIIVDIANALAAFLKKNPRYEVMVSRDRYAWHPTLKAYFDSHGSEIDAFRKSLALEMVNNVRDGHFVLEEEQVFHNSATPQGALQLYGINKFANDTGYDIVLHLHVNDHAGRRVGEVGNYDGFTIYAPDRQYGNSEVSLALARSLAARLSAYHATSTLPLENRGVLEDQQLIAVGANNSVKSAALLIEYGYIFEPQFQNRSVFTLAARDYAYQTYLGLQDFFNDPVKQTYGSIAFPRDWSTVTAVQNARGPGVYALQAALRHLGFYPPAGTSFVDCPISGKAGPCTRAAIMEYQAAHGLSAVGYLGPKTRAALRSDLSSPQ